MLTCEAIDNLAEVITAFSKGDWGKEYVEDCLWALYNNAVKEAVEILRGEGLE